MSKQNYGGGTYKRRPKAPDVGPRKDKPAPRRPEFTAFAVVMADRIILRTPYDKELIEAIKQVPSQLRTFVKDGRPLERGLREHLMSNEDYFSSHDDLATMVGQLVDSIAKANGLSDSWAISLAAPELFEWTLAASLKQFPDLQLYDVRILAEPGPGETGSPDGAPTSEE